MDKPKLKARGKQFFTEYFARLMYKYKEKHSFDKVYIMKPDENNIPDKCAIGYLGLFNELKYHGIFTQPQLDIIVGSYDSLFSLIRHPIEYNYSSSQYNFNLNQINYNFLSFSFYTSYTKHESDLMDIYSPEDMHYSIHYGFSDDGESNIIILESKSNTESKVIARANNSTKLVPILKYLKIPSINFD